MSIAAKLDAAINAVCPIHGVSIGRMNDKKTWRIDFKDEATAEQREAARSALDAFNVEAAQLPTPQELIAGMERDGIPEQKIDGGYIRGVREYMLGGAAMFNACNQIIEALEAKIREIGGPSYADFTAPRLPDISQTPGMQKVKSLDDQIKALRAQI